MQLALWAFISTNSPTYIDFFLLVFFISFLKINALSQNYEIGLEEIVLTFFICKFVWR